MKLYLIAGEDSGDMHAANLLKALRMQGREIGARGVGGDLLAAQGMELVAHVRDINFMGFVEVVKHLGTIRKLFRTVKEDMQRFQPDAVVLVDYPGFNLRMAPFIKDLGIPLIYYISPQLWAWKKGRIRKVQKYVDRMLVILPFEEEFYQKEGVDVAFVGHPLLDAISNRARKAHAQPTIALLPGSRKQEIQRMLPIMLGVVSHFPDYQFIVAGAPSQEASFYERILGDAPVQLRMNETHQVLREADFAVVTSGTATLETGIFQVPQVVVYKGSNISYQIAKRLVQVKYLSLVNLILDRPAVPELIQHECTPAQIAATLQQLMQPTRAVRMEQDYADLMHKLGAEGASARAATEVLRLLG